ncbi:ATP-dependent Clp protease ATP-binding subunit ClpA homolog, chloroplastic-like [Prosopis cineraria]|uniref:ATP-dependent Clp protease ATP-binding subunit ClpA homolog, chloroplastic-like n=1 Tax=Prosopis cineraria TaxID=364024 RepID=UPI002410A69F|nr:ATP-dependent Clp protease ATP-binding subunit ClpA homolog, chloroplastic-like [Prosopis cineraria]
MLEGFTESANKVMIGAQQEAHLLGHKYISTEHILLALISDDVGGLAAKALQSAKLDLNVIREQAEEIFGKGGGSSGSFSMELRFSCGAQLVLKLTREEAQKLGHSFADERDLLLGLLKGCDGKINGLLQNQGVDVNNIRDQVSKHMADEKEKAYSLNDQFAQGCSNENSQKPSLTVPIKMVAGEKEKPSYSNDQCAQGSNENSQKPTLSAPIKMIANEKVKASCSNDQYEQGCSNENSQKPILPVSIKMIVSEKEKAYSSNDQCAQGYGNENSQKPTLIVPIKLIASEKETSSSLNDQCPQGFSNDDSQQPTVSVPIKMIAGEMEKTPSSNEQCAQGCSNENSQKTTLSVPIKMITGEEEKVFSLNDQCAQGCSDENSQKPTLSMPTKMIAGEKEKTSTSNEQFSQGCSDENSQKRALSAPTKMIADEKEKGYGSNDQCARGCSDENSQKPILNVSIKMIAGEKEKPSSSNDQCVPGCGNENSHRPAHSVPIKIINMMPASENIEAGSKKVDKIMNYQTPILDMFGTNLTKLAQECKLNPFVGRHDRVERTIQIFCRRTKNNPCLVGEPGVGKTATIDGLAQRILSGSVPEKLKGKKVIKLDLAHFLYETSCQKTPEERTSCLIKEIAESGDVILFINKVHSFFDATNKGTHKFSYILKRALQSGTIQCIGSATVDEYRMHIEKDEALQRIFQSVDVAEPSIEETVKILKGLRGMYGTHHNVLYTDEALEAAAKLSQKYICGRFLPEKAIDLIDEAGSYVQHFPAKDKRKLRSFFPEVTKSDIQQIVSSWTGIPVRDVSREEGECLLNLEEKLRNYVIGQNEAINTVCRAIRRASLGLGHMTKPIASFLFTGPTGVGKIKLAKALATQYFGSEDAMIRIDMSECMDRHKASRIVGAPLGYFGFHEAGQLTKAVRHRPYSLVLLDEIDKAHSDIFNLMLQILDDGKLTDGQGHTVDFKNTLIVMTSSMRHNKMNEAESNCIKKLVMEETKQYFRPEFLKRLDEIIAFNELTKMDVKQIADLMLRQVSERMKRKDIELTVTHKFSDHVVEHGYEPSYCARALKRAISRLLEDALVEKMLTKEIRKGDSIVVDVTSDGNVVLKHKNDLVSCINLNRNIAAVGKRGKDNGVTCNLMSKMFDLLGNQKSP